MAESFFSSLKGELTDTRAWPTRATACRAIVEYIAWYNGTGTAPWDTAAPPTSKMTTTESSGM